MPSDFSVVAIIAAFNEADIIAHVVRDLIDQGIHVYFLDDGSTDRTVAAVEPYLGRGVIGIELLSDTVAGGGKPAGFEWERILRRKTQLATELDATWFIHHDADEFRESPWSQLSLRDAIRHVDALGFNAIDFVGLDFWPVHDRFRAGDDVREAFTSYAELAPYDRLQIRCWKKTADLDLASSGGHEAQFPDRRVFPLRFVLRHYPIRGQAHGERKVFRERQFPEEERAKGWHVQYDQMHTGESFIRDPAMLVPYDPDAVRVALTLRHRGVEVLESSLADVRSVLESSRREFEASQQELAWTRDALAARSAEAAALRSNLAQRTTALTEARHDLAARNAELSAAGGEIARLRDVLGHRDAEIEGLRDVLGHRDAEIQGLRDVLGHRDAELQRLRDVLGHRDAAIAGLRDTLGQGDAEIKGLRDVLGHRDAEIKGLRDVLGHRDAAIAGLRDALGHRDGEIAGLRHTREHQSTEIAGQRDALRERAVEIERWRSVVEDGARRIDAFERSLSWRWTSPARAAARLFRGR